MVLDYFSIKLKIVGDKLFPDWDKSFLIGEQSFLGWDK
jgi:hypothetical protein